MNYKELANFYDVAPDFSEKFTDRVEEMRSVLELIVNCPVTHDDDMNYAAAQKLIFYIDQDGAPTSQETAANKIVFYISSKAKFVSYLMFPKLRKNIWGPPILKISNSHSAINRIATIFADRIGYTIPDIDLHQEVEGRATELDGKPATIFEILYSEIY